MFAGMAGVREIRREWGRFTVEFEPDRLPLEELVRRFHEQAAMEVTILSDHVPQSDSNQLKGRALLRCGLSNALGQGTLWGGWPSVASRLRLRRRERRSQAS